MKYAIYYIGFNDRVYSQENIEDAFYLATGKTADSHRSEFIKYLNDCFGKSISGYFPATVENLLAHGCKVRAIALYRKEHACSILEAREAIEKLITQN